MNHAPQLGMNFRVTHQNDPVPPVLILSLGFHHASPDYFIASNTGVVPTIAEISIQKGTSN
jgi:triacylglycerol lipase